MPDHSPSTDERASLTQPSQSSSPLECTSHLGFSLVTFPVEIFQDGFPRRRGDTPATVVPDASTRTQTPHGRVEGRTFEFVFDLPWTAKADRSSKAKQKLTRKARRKNTARRPHAKPKQPTQPTLAQLTTKRKDKPEYDQQRSTTPERREHNRRHAQERRKLARESGNCRDCRNPAKQGQIRCEPCAEKHRVGRRKNDAQRRAPAKQPTAPGQQAKPMQT